MIELPPLCRYLVLFPFILIFSVSSFSLEYLNDDYDSSKIVTQIVTIQKEATEKFFEDDWKLFLNHIQAEKGVEMEKPLDPNSYFKILKHVSMEENWTLDYVYWFGEGGGRPYLYAKKNPIKPSQI